MKRSILIFTLSIFIISHAQAQFIQRGKTLEYNGLNSKSVYSGLVQLNFMGAASTINDKGLFSLKFNQLDKGNAVKQFDIDIVDKAYVLFNKKDLSRWVLTSDFDMEVLLCKKSRIDDLIAIYSKNYIDNLNIKYQNALSKLKETNDDKKVLEKEIQKLRMDYETRISIIKSQSVMFAYVDETKLDSLELLKRKYILENNLSAAYEIGKQINYSGIAEDYMSNITVFNREISSNIDNLLALIDNYKIHIENIKQQVDRYGRYTKGQEDEIRNNLQSLVKINEFVYNLYNTKLRCTDEYLFQLKNEYGQSLLQLAEFLDWKDKRPLLEQSADLGNAMAMYELGMLTSNQFDTSKQWFQKCMESANDINIKNMAEEELETFPDFMTIVQGDTIYCHILSNKEFEISICDFHPKDIKRYDSIPLKVPSFVKHNKKKYSVKKIAKHSFRNCCVYRWPNSPFSHDSQDLRSRSYDTVIFQEPLETIGESSFAFSGVRNVTFPKSLRTIKRRAFDNYWVEMRKFDIPEGVERIEEEIYNYDAGESNDTLSISLPSTLNYLHKNAFIGSIIIDKLELNPSNKYFKLINGVLYSADSTAIYSEIIPYNTKVLFLSDYMTLSDISENVFWKTDSLTNLRISNKHSHYKNYEDVVYSNDFSSIISVPKGHKTIVLHPNLTDYSSVTSGVLGKTEEHRNIIIPKQLHPNTKYALYLNFINDSIKHINKYDISLFDETISNPIDFDRAVYLATNVIENVDDSVLLSDSWYKSESAITKNLYQKQLARQIALYGGSKVLLIQQADAEITLLNLAKAHELYRQAGLSEKEISDRFVEWGRYYWLGKNDVSQCYKHALDCFNYCISIYNNPLAAYLIGVIYENGYSVELNVDIAIKWFKHSIEWGANFSGPSYNLGCLYYFGDKVQQNYSLAKHYFEIAAYLDNADAYNFLGNIYNGALSVERDINKSIHYYEKAIEKGDKKYAPSNLGTIYYHEVSYRDYTKAYSYFTIAEENKNASALNMIAYMKAFAYGTNHNLAEAMYYINKAISDSPSIINYLDSKGEILIMSDRLDEAKQIWYDMMAKDSIEVEKLKPESNFLKAIVYNRKEEVLLKLFELGDSVNSPYLLGNLSLQDKDIAKAKKYYEIASGSGNENAKVALYVVKQIMKDGRNDWRDDLIKIWHNTPIITICPINEISFSSDGNRIMGDSRKGGSCYIWSSSGDELIYYHKYNQSYDQRATFSPDGKYVIIECSEGNHPIAQVWDVEKDTLCYSVTCYHISRPNISKNGKFFLSYDKNDLDFYDKISLKLREIDSGKIVFSRNFRNYVDYAGFSTDGNCIVAVAGTHIYIYDLKTGADNQTYNYSYTEMDKAIISPDNSRMICYKGKYHYVDIWSIKTGKIVNTIRHNARINDACIDNHSQYVATASADSTAVIWDLTTGVKLKTFSHKSAVSKVRFSPDGRLLATMSSNAILLWDLENGSLVKSPLVHDSTVLDFNFSPDGKKIVSSTNNNVCRLWDVESGSEITSTYIPAGWFEHQGIGD